MPSPRPTRTIVPADLGNRGTWRPKRQKAAGLPPRAKQLIELMVFGSPDGTQPAMSRAEAATFMRISKNTSRQYAGLPAARSYFNELCARLREGEVPKNIHRAIQISNNDKLLDSAAGSRAIIEANRYIEMRRRQVERRDSQRRRRRARRQHSSRLPRRHFRLHGTIADGRQGPQPVRSEADAIGPVIEAEAVSEVPRPSDEPAATRRRHRLDKLPQFKGPTTRPTEVHTAPPLYIEE